MEIANSVEPVQEGRIRRSTGRSCPSARVGTGLKLAIERGWLRMHESGAYVKLTDAGAAPFA